MSNAEIKSINNSAELLALLPEDMREAMNVHIRRLSSLFSAIDNQRREGKVELDGFAGLSRQEDYNRLLLTEWALAQHHPQEFTRRAVMGEHLFLEPMRKQPQASQVSVMLLDTGPFMVGYPRLVQLALLVVMWRRAERAGIDFVWGVLQDESCSLHNQLSEELIRNWLQSRTPKPLSNVHAVGWHQTLLPMDLSECWIVAASPVAIRHPLREDILIEQGAAHTQQQVSIKGRSRSAVNLSFDDDMLALRMLRNPFEQPIPVNSERIDDAVAGIAGISRNGKKIAFHTLNHRLDIYAVPGSANEALGKPQHMPWPKDQYLIALGMTKKHTMALTSDGQDWYFRGFKGQQHIFKRSRSQQIALPKSGAPANHMERINNHGYKDELWLLDDKEQLRVLDLKEPNSLFRTESKSVLLLGSSLNTAYYVCWDNGAIEFVWNLGSYAQSRRRFKLGLEKKPRVFVHSSGQWANNSIGCFLVEMGHLKWRVYIDLHEYDFELGQDTRVLGALCRQDEGPWLVSWSKHKGKHNVWLTDADQVRRCIYESAEDIKSISLNSQRDDLHIVCSNGDVVVFSIFRNQVLMELGGKQ